MAYIQDLEKENKRLLLYIEEMQEQFSAAQDMAQKSQLLIDDTIDIPSFQQMQERIKLLEEENQLAALLSFATRRVSKIIYDTIFCRS